MGGRRDGLRCFFFFPSFLFFFNQNIFVERKRFPGEIPAVTRKPVFPPKCLSSETLHPVIVGPCTALSSAEVHGSELGLEPGVNHEPGERKLRSHKVHAPEVKGEVGHKYKPAWSKGRFGPFTLMLP